VTGVAGLILAAGASRRMGRPKALLTFQNETFIGRLQRIFLAHCTPVVVVLGHDADLIRPSLDPRVQAVVNPDPERGMLSSLQTGLRVLSDRERILFLPLDYPAIHSDTVAKLCASPRCVIAMPRFEGTRGHPVLISRAVADELIGLPVTAAARDVIRGHDAEIHYVDVADPAILMDVDTPGDYDALVHGSSRL
jgi:molybdenum cofactor cytidylyltransferase